MKDNLLIGYNYILHYRKPFFNELSKHYNVTVLHSGKPCVDDDDDFSEIIVPVSDVGPFFLQRGLVKEVLGGKYDAVILLFDVRWVNTLISIVLNSFLPKKNKLILWGAWITKSSIANTIRLFLSKMAYANVFYTAEAKNGFIDQGLKGNNLYVANNTFDVPQYCKAYRYEDKFRLLFVGSLDERKKNQDLIRAFHQVIEQLPSQVVLTFVGDGMEKSVLLSLAEKLSLGSRVEFIGRLEDPTHLARYYREAIVSISYGQAGLAVLQSMGFGVPFLTHKHAISGGEKSNIKHNQNSVFCEDIKSLQSEIIRFSNDLNLARTMGEKAYDYYRHFCTIENMVQGFRDAIEGTNLARVDEILK